jgi:hypothetical protein
MGEEPMQREARAFASLSAFQATFLVRVFWNYFRYSDFSTGL